MMTSKITSDNDTIFALATAAPRAAIAVIRISGAATDTALRALGVRRLPPPRQLHLRRLYHPHTATLLDEAMIVRFAAPHSFSGEDMAELHCHGGRATTQAILTALADIEGLRAATAGEFTRRAVINGRMDLTAAEAIADLIDAEGEAQQAQALQQMSGALRQLFEGWCAQLTAILAHLEAELEFADENLTDADLAENITERALARLPDLRATLATHLADQRGLKLRDGLRIVLSGAPNVGKSSIINALSGKPAAIVAAQSGTTRDVIEVAMVLAGVPVTLIDTAGLRVAQDAIEREGVRRAAEQARMADICLLVRAPDTTTDTATDAMPEGIADSNTHILRILNKIDLIVARPLPDDLDSDVGCDVGYDLAISAKTGAGLDALRQCLETQITSHFATREAPVLTRSRHRAAVQEALDAIDRALANKNLGAELVAEDIRLAVRHLGRITGAVDVESLLDIVFADFCIGK